MQKDLQGHLNLYTWEAFRDELLNPKAPADDEARGGVTENACVVADLQLVGVAAGQVTEPDLFATPEDKKAKKAESKLKKMPSSSSLRPASEPGTAGASPSLAAGSESKDDATSVLPSAVDLTMDEAKEEDDEASGELCLAFTLLISFTFCMYLSFP